MLWMSGGPGASSVAFGLFQELGPCIIDGVDATKPNPYAWNNNANVIFVECVLLSHPFPGITPMLTARCKANPAMLGTPTRVSQ